MADLNFPASPGPAEVYGSWQWDGVKWVGLPVGSDGGGGSGGIPEAPLTGIGYGRLNATWTPVLMQSGDVLDGGNF